ncbi:MAG: hypothetical protein QM770_23030 [Tepidisphaeraceae bacterium]
MSNRFSGFDNRPFAITAPDAPSELTAITSSAEGVGTFRPSTPLGLNQMKTFQVRGLSSPPATSTAPGEPEPLVRKLTLTSGYDTNPSTAGDADGSPVGAAAFSAQYTFGRNYDASLETYEQSLSVGYTFAASIFDGSQDENDEIDHELAVEYFRRWGGRDAEGNATDVFDLTADVTNTLIMIDWKTQLYVLELSPTLAYHPTPDSTIGLTYSFQWLDFDAAGNNQDRHTGGLQLAKSFESDQAAGEVFIAASHVWNQAEADAADWDANQVSVGVRQLRFWNARDLPATLSLKYTVQWRDYSSADRDDVVQGVELAGGLSLAKWIKVAEGQKLNALLKYNCNWVSSDLDAAEYEQHIVLVGISYQF